MKLNFKKLMTAGLVALGIGAVLFAVAFIAVGFDFNKLTGMEWEDKSFVESTEASVLNVDADGTDVTLKYDKNADKISISYAEYTKRGDKVVKSFAITEADGKLTVKENTNWLYHLQLWSSCNSEMTITIPEGRVLTLNICADDIDIIGNATVGSLVMCTDNGDIDILNAITADNVTLITDNGDVTLRDTVTAADVALETDNGEIKINRGITAKSLIIETDNGETELEGAFNIIGTFSIETDNGEVDAEDAIITASKILIDSDNADVEMTLYGKASDYKTSVEIDNGKTNVKNNLSGERELYIESDNGDVYVYFSNN